MKLLHQYFLWILALLSLAAVGIALVAQHYFGLEPCPWCILQRILFLLIALVCMLASMLRAPFMRRSLITISLLASMGGIGAALWQHFVAARSTSCALTFADKIITGLQLDTLVPDVFEVRGSCADATYNVLGLPFEFWSLILFVLAAVLSVRTLVHPKMIGSI